MNERFLEIGAQRRLRRGICLVVRDNQESRDPTSDKSVGRVTKFPSRPKPAVISESIPLFFIARNRVGLWVAREAEGRTGGIFLFKRSAVRFAKRNSAPSGCATMFLAERLELDLENDGNRPMGWIGAALNAVARYIPEYPPPILVTPRNQKGKWQ